MNLFTFDLQRFTNDGTWSENNDVYEFTPSGSDTASIRISGLKTEVTDEQLKSAISVSDTKAVTIINTEVLDDNSTGTVTIEVFDGAFTTQPFGEDSDIAESTKLTGWKRVSSGTYGYYDTTYPSSSEKYSEGYRQYSETDEGDTSDVTYVLEYRTQDDTPDFTLSGLSKKPDNNTVAVEIHDNFLTNSTVTILDESVIKGDSVTLTKGTKSPTLKLDSIFPTDSNATTAGSWTSITNGTATYTLTTTTDEHWEKTADTTETQTYTLTDGTSDPTLKLDVSGIQSKNGITVTGNATSGYTVTIPATAIATGSTSVSVERKEGSANFSVTLTDVETTSKSHETTGWGTTTTGDGDNITGVNWSSAVGNDNTISYVKATTYDDYWASSTVDNKTTYTLTHTDDTYEELFKLSGVKSTAGITFSGTDDKTVTVPQTAVADGVSSVSLDGSGYSLNLNVNTNENPQTSYAWSDVNSNNAADYKVTTTKEEYWSKDGNTYTHHDADLGTATTILTLNGIKSTAGITVTPTTTGEGDATVTTYAVEVPSTALKDSFNDGDKIQLTGTSAGNATLTISGITTADSGAQTYSDTWSEVSDNSASYQRTTTTAEYWSKSGQTYTFNATNTSATPDTLFTISGIKSTAGITFSDDGKTVNVPSTALKDNLGNESVSLTKGNGVNIDYALNLTSVTVSDTAPASTDSYSWSLDSTTNTATYTKTTSTPEYWTKDANGNYVHYASSTDSVDLFTISGIQFTANISVTEDPANSGNYTVSVPSANFVGTGTPVALEVTEDVTGTLELTGVTTTEPTPLYSYDWGTYDSTNHKVTYIETKSTEAYWKKADNADSYTYQAAASTPTNLFTLNGIKTTAGVDTTLTKGTDGKVTGATITVSASALDDSIKAFGGKLELTETDSNRSLNLAMGEGVVTTKPTSTYSYAWGDVSDNAAEYKVTTTTAEYWEPASTEGPNTSYTYQPMTNPTTTEFTLSGIEATTGINVTQDGDKYKVSVPSSTFKSNLVDGDKISLTTAGGVTPIRDYALELTDIKTEETAVTKTVNSWGEITSDEEGQSTSVTLSKVTMKDDYWTKDASTESYTLTKTPTSPVEQLTISGLKSDLTEAELETGLSAENLTDNNSGNYEFSEANMNDLFGLVKENANKINIEPATGITISLNSAINAQTGLVATETDGTYDYYLDNQYNKDGYYLDTSSHDITKVDTASQKAFTISGLKTGLGSNDITVQPATSGGYEVNIPSTSMGTGGESDLKFNNGSFVAKIGDDYYTSLRAAIEFAADGATIEMLADDNVSLTDGSKLEISKAITINGNGKTIYGKSNWTTEPTTWQGIDISGSGNVTINNLKLTEFGDNYYCDRKPCPVHTDSSYTGKLTLDTVTIDKFCRQAVRIEGGSFEIKDCTITCNAQGKNTAALDENTAATYDWFQQGIEVRGSATGTIFGTTISGVHADFAQEKYDNGDNAIYNAYSIVSWSSGDVTVDNCTINGGTTKSKWHGASGGIDNSGTGKITVKDTTITADHSLDIWTGTIEVTSGTYTGQLGLEDASSNGTLNISGGTFNGSINKPENGTLNTNITGGQFSEKNSNFNITTTVVPNDGSGEYYTVESAIPSGYTTITIDGEKYAFQTDADISSYTSNCVAIIGTAGSEGAKYFTSLADAINEATSGSTVTLLADVTLSKMLTISEEKEFTLDLNGKAITSTEAAFNVTSGTVTVQDTGTNGTITSTSTDSDCIYVYGGTLNVKGGSITGNNHGIYVDGGEVNVTGGTITGTSNSSYGIYNNGSRTVSISEANSAKPTKITGGRAALGSMGSEVKFNLSGANGVEFNGEVLDTSATSNNVITATINSVEQVTPSSIITIEYMTYAVGTTGWTQSGNVWTCIYKDGDEVIAKSLSITGLKEGLTESDLVDANIEINTATGAVTIKSASLLPTEANQTLSIKGGTIALDSSITSETFTTATWQETETEGTYKYYEAGGTTEGYTLTETGTTGSYTLAKVADTSKVTISGLKSGLDNATNITVASSSNGKYVVEIPADSIDTTNPEGLKINDNSFEAKIGDTYYTSFADAIDAASIETSQTITLLADVTLSKMLTISKNLTLDLNGKTITAAEGKTAFEVTVGTVTVQDNSTGGSITGNDYGIDVKSGKVDVTGGTIEGNNHGIYVAGGTVEVTGGEIKGTNRYGIYIANALGTVSISEAEGKTTKITGGTAALGSYGSGVRFNLSGADGVEFGVGSNVTELKTSANENNVITTTIQSTSGITYMTYAVGTTGWTKTDAENNVWTCIYKENENAVIAKEFTMAITGDGADNFNPDSYFVYSSSAITLKDGAQKEALGSLTVTITNGDVTFDTTVFSTPANKKEAELGWQPVTGTAGSYEYFAEDAKTEGYTVVDGKELSYSAATPAAVKISVSDEEGVVDSFNVGNYFEVSGSTITLKSDVTDVSALAGLTFTATSGTFGTFTPVGDVVAGWQEVTGTAGSYEYYAEGAKTAGFTVVDGTDGKELSYSAATPPAVTINGLANNNNKPTPVDGTITFTADNFAGNNISLVSNAGNYKFKLQGDLAGKKFTGSNLADSIITDSNASGVSIEGKAGADVFIYDGGTATIEDYRVADGDKISLASGYTIDGKPLIDSEDVKINFTNGGQLIVKGAASLEKLDIYSNNQDQPTSYDIVSDLVFNKEDETKATAVTVYNSSNNKGDFGVLDGTSEKYANLYTINAAISDSTIVGNAKNNQIIVSGGDENLLVGGLGKDSITFGNGSSGLIADFGIGATKEGTGKTFAKKVTQDDTSTYTGYDRTDTGSYFANVDYLKVQGKVTGVYFDNAKNPDTDSKDSKKDATFSVIVTYNDGTADDVIVLRDVVKKPVKTGSNVEYQSNYVAASTFKIYEVDENDKATAISSGALTGLFKEAETFVSDCGNSLTSIVRALNDKYTAWTPTAIGEDKYGHKNSLTDGVTFHTDNTINRIASE